MDGWNPKIDKFGRVVSGSGTIFFQNHYRNPPQQAKQIAGGWTPAFLDNNNIVFNNGVDTSYYSIPNQSIRKSSERYDKIVASQGRMIGNLVGIVTFEGHKYDGISISISKSGANVAWITPYQTLNLQRVPVFNTNNVQYSAVISEISIGDHHSVWSENDRRTTAAVSFTDGLVRDITVFTWEVAHVCDAIDKSYVVSYTQQGLAIRELGSKFGWFFQGIWENPDSIYYNGLIVIVASDDSGNSKYLELDPNSPTVDLTETIDGIHYSPDPPIPPDPPDPIPIPPEPTPEPPPEEGIRTAKGYKMTEETRKVGLIALDGKYIAFDSKGKVSFNNTSPQPFIMSQPDSLFAFKQEQTGAYLGADATQYSQDICKQLYLISERGPYESWNVEHPSDSPDLISAFITFRRPEGNNFSIKLLVVEL